jgi:hypothetical protein
MGKIQFVHLGSGADGNNPLVVEFKAFIKRFNDSFSGDWKEAQYPNQSVPIAHQVRPRRDIHLEWTVPASTEAEAISNLGKCGALAQMMFPTLKPAGSWSSRADQEMYFPKSSFIAIKFGNMIQKWDGSPLPGYIKGFNYTPNFEEGVLIANRAKKTRLPKQIKAMMDTESKKEGLLVPMFVDISLDFTPFYIRQDVGYKHGTEDEWAQWMMPSWPYSVDFEEATADSDEKAGTKKTDICITKASEGGYYDVCSRTMFAGARGVTK